MKIKNFAIIKGENTKISDGKIEYSPSMDKVFEEEKISELDADEIRSNIFFSEGILEFKTRIEDPNTAILVVWKNEDQFSGSIGHSYKKKSFIFANKSGNKLAGGFSKYDSTKEFKFKIEIKGSNAKLYINEVLILENNFTIKEAPIFFRIFSKGNVVISEVNVEIQKPKLFVVMQFSEDYNNLYNEVIKPVAEQEGFECVRGDEFFTSTPILNDIIATINESKVIIAEITPDNPNVFYEIGYAHAINKPTILLCDRKREKLPFDISSFRTLFYVNSIAGKTAIENSLRKYLENIK